MEHFYKLIDQAISWVNQSDIDDNLKDAIKCRLAFRRDFLAAVEQDIAIMETKSTEHFESCLKQLPTLKKSFDLGKPVPDSWSLKIQRKLASTLPPRPMVNVSPEDALAHLTRLCEDAIDIKEIVDYRGSYNLKVLLLSYFRMSLMFRLLSGLYYPESHSPRFIFVPLLKLLS